MMPFSKEALEIIRADEAGELPPVSEELAARMQVEADTTNFLLSPEGAEARKIWNMTWDEVEDRHAGELNADAYDEEDAERENDPETDPALLEDRTMETYQAMAERDAKAWNRRHRR